MQLSSHVQGGCLLGGRNSVLQVDTFLAHSLSNEIHQGSVPRVYTPFSQTLATELRPGSVPRVYIPFRLRTCLLSYSQVPFSLALSSSSSRTRRFFTPGERENRCFYNPHHQSLPPALHCLYNLHHRRRASSNTLLHYSFVEPKHHGFCSQFLWPSSSLHHTLLTCSAHFHHIQDGMGLVKPVNIPGLKQSYL